MGASRVEFNFLSISLVDSGFKIVVLVSSLLMCVVEHVIVLRANVF